MDLKIIKTIEDYNSAIQRFEEIFSAKAGTQKVMRLMYYLY